MITTLDFGPGAGFLPGPEIIGTFDPLQYRIGTHDISHIPGSDALLRWYTPLGRESSVGSISGDAADLHAHLTLMKERAGDDLHVPSHRTFVAEPAPTWEGSTIYTVVEPVAGEKLTSTDPRGLAALRGMAKYLEGVKDERHTRVLKELWAGQVLLDETDATFVDLDAAFSNTPRLDIPKIATTKLLPWLNLLDIPRTHPPRQAVARMIRRLIEIN